MQLHVHTCTYVRKYTHCILHDNLGTIFGTHTMHIAALHTYRQL